MHLRASHHAAILKYVRLATCSWAILWSTCVFGAAIYISPIPNQVLDQHRTLVVPLHVAGDTSGGVNLTAKSNNPELLPAGSLDVDQALGAISITPNSNIVGNAAIEIVATGSGVEVSTTFQLEVRAAARPLIAHRVHGDSPFAVRTRDGAIIMGNGPSNATAHQSWTWLNFPDDILTTVPFIHEINAEPVFYGTQQAFPQNATFTLQPDGTPQRIGTGFVHDLAVGNGTYVGITASQIYTSIDALNWIPQTAPILENRALHRVVFGNGKFVVMGDDQILFSTNGKEWSVANRPDSSQWKLPALAFGEGKFLAIGHGYALMGWPSASSSLVSVDGENWHYIEGGNPVGFVQIRDIIHHAGRFVAVGATTAASSGLIASSEDGSSWTWRFWHSPNLIFGLTETNGHIVATGEGILLNSQDGGLSWSGTSWGEGIRAVRTDFTGGAVIGRRFLVSGSTGELFRSEQVPRLVAHYALDGSATDWSGNELHGTVHGGMAATDRFGNALGALRFDGVDDYVDCGNAPAFNFPSNFTMSAWVKSDGAQPNRYIVSKYPYSSTNKTHSYGLAFEEASKAYAFVSGGGPAYSEARASAPLNDGQWHALAMVYDATFGIRLYVDGNLDGSVAAPHLSAFENAAPMTIGSLTSGFYFGGLMDDVRIYSDALTEPEVRNLHSMAEVQLQITRQPLDAEIHAGTNAVFRIEIAGTGASAARFQWFVNGVLVPNATNSVYVTGLHTSPGTNTITATVTDSSGSTLLTSEPATLTILPPANVASGLLAHWAFDDEFTIQIKDETGAHPGQLSNGARIAGRIGSGALQFFGTNSFIFVGGINTALMLTNTPYTISWWQKWDGPRAWHQNIFAMDDGADYSGGYSSYIAANTANISYVHDDGVAQAAWANVAQAAPAWRHYAVTYDGETLRFYVHGQLLNSGILRRPLIQDGDDPLVLGALRLQNGSITNFFRGALDDFRIYNRALSVTEIGMLGPEPEISVLEQPLGYRIAAGASVTLRAAASVVGTTEPLRFQWEIEGNPVPGATNATFVVTGATGTTKKVRVHFTAGNLETYSEEADVVTVSPSEARLLLHLDFEELMGDKLVNKATGETNVQVTGEAPLTVGRVGELGIAMNGGRLVVQAAESDLELVGSSYTIAWWMRQTRPANLPLYALGNYLGAPVRNGYAGVLQLGGNQFHAHHASTQAGGAVADAPLAVNLPRWTNWLHVAVVYNGSQRMIYTNGLLAASRQATGPIIGSGRDDLNIGGTWFGVLDDFRIYNYALASDELAALVNVSRPESRMQILLDSAGLLVRWPDDPTTQYRVDYSTALGANASWQPLSAPAQSVDGYIEMRPAITGTSRYFRLRKL